MGINQLILIISIIVQLISIFRTPQPPPRPTPQPPPMIIYIICSTAKEEQDTHQTSQDALPECSQDMPNINCKKR